MKGLISLVVISFFLILVGCTDENEVMKEGWELTGTFESNEREMVGLEERLGLLPGTGLIVNEESKQMWHFWGEREFLSSKDFDIKATHKETREVIDLFYINGDGIGSPNNGADTHIPSTLKFPLDGKWKLDIYHGEEIFESIIINVGY
ncbi:hypothetical protein [Alkalibacillus haloalkaliphilus]|uniref:hypothetical protein n=1 Tax=Alkalibacillus haloalkaliphilus TaxID=94136 RepID=UPI0029356CDC|nr:hypothetical protein [Alkalibacillus haloalkaliphilus]MDV2581584.1 hypothetical protein [Alkalibacillus haloalkaliphilus]